MMIFKSEKHASSEKPKTGDGVLLRNTESKWVNITCYPDNLGLSYEYHYPDLYPGKVDTYYKFCPPFHSGTIVTIVQE